MLRACLKFASNRVTQVHPVRIFRTSRNLLKSMTRTPSFPDISPPIHRGIDLETLRRSKDELFSVELDVLAARVPAREVGRLKQELEPVTLTLPKISAVRDDGASKATKLLLFDKKDRVQLPAEILDIIERNTLETMSTSVRLGYDYWTAHQILRAILPDELASDLPTSFTTVGHIAHFNIREEYLPYKYIIGQVILDKNPGIETVVNKLDEISNEFRFFKMEVLAGKPDFMVEVSECNCRFRFDFSTVYWNSRLQAEHTRLVDSFNVRDVVVDGFAGVGPFAIPAAKKGCLGVLANDLNPASAESCKENAVLNKVQDRIRCYNMDGGEFFKKATLEAYDQPFKPPPMLNTKKVQKEARRQRDSKKARLDKADSAMNGNKPAAETALAATSETPGTPDSQNYEHLGRFVDHFISNLPATAIDFLSHFQGLYTPFMSTDTPQETRSLFVSRLIAYSRARGQKEGVRLPMAHIYCFTKELERPEEDIQQRATKTLGYPVSNETLRDYSVSLVRSVAPKKDMYRLSFRLPEEVVFGKKVDWEKEVL